MSMELQASERILKASEKILEASERILKASEKILEASEKMNDSFKILAQAILKGVFEPDIGSRNSAVAQAQVKVQNLPFLTDEGKLFMIEYLVDPILAGTFLSINGDSLSCKWIKRKFPLNMLLHVQSDL
ncbi:hypothetical protein K3495_g13353 [Podosphaera aphanis]|nr:hypothetical protein K3495_g13353 [Podosphaera aphanis]